MAELRIETEGDYPGAVRVFVGGVQLASIPHDYTLAYQSVVEELGRASRPATLHVRLEADDYVDVWGFCEPKVRPPDEPLLCPQETEFVNLHDGVAEQLDTSLKSRARTKVVQRIGLLERSGDDPWRVILEGQEIGVLRRAPFMRLREAEAAGLSLATVVDIRRKPERPLAVSVGFPRDD